MDGGWAKAADLTKGASGYALCRWCGLETRPPRRTFCSDYCVHEWKLRTSPAYLRECLLRRDHGVCAVCTIDTIKEWNRIRRLRWDKRLLVLEGWGAGRRKSLWDADHIVPVAEGGGECDLENLRTLCLKCHRQATADLRARLAAKPAKSAASG
jgi:5-methylcytosine-specific restriction endonuclease McrA